MENKVIAAARHIMVIGDSVAKGVTFDAKRSRYVMNKEGVWSMARSKFSAVLDCYAKFGCTISTAYDTLMSKLRGLDDVKPEYAVIEIGGNDCDFNWQEIARDPYGEHMPNTPLPKYKEILKSMIGEVSSLGIRPVLVNLPPIDADKYFRYFTKGDKEVGDSIIKWLGEVGKIYWWHERYNAALEYIGDITDTHVINVRQAFLSEENYREFISEDGIHPNDRGYKLMADAILEDVRRRAPALVV